MAVLCGAEISLLTAGMGSNVTRSGPGNSTVQYSRNRIMQHQWRLKEVILGGLGGFPAAIKLEQKIMEPVMESCGFKACVCGYRGKSDCKNSVTSGCITGGVIGFPAGQKAGVLGCDGFAAFSVITATDH